MDESRQIRLAVGSGGAAVRLRCEANVKLYRLLTGGDDAAFCKKVSEALNKGWQLHGSPSVAVDSGPGRVVCAQAVVKEVAGEWSDGMLEPEFKLSAQ